MHTCRLISRAILIHFEQVSSRASIEQEDHDVRLAMAMQNADSSVGAIVSLGKSMIINRQEFVEVILPRVQSVLQEAIYRVQHSYALAIIATLKVSY